MNNLSSKHRCPAAEPLRFFDMFAGIGGFRAGLERAGGYECVGHCEIDKHAERAYRAAHQVKESEVFYEDATTINTDDMPDFDLLCGGFPCQAFSIAGKRQGFADPRGTLFFEIARVVRAKRPAYLLLENVPGLLSHDQGRTFAAILNELCELGYGVEWQVLNSKDFGVPQSRKRVYIVGYLDRRCAGEVLPLGGANPASLIQVLSGRQDSRIGSLGSLANGEKTGLYMVGYNRKDGFTGRINTAYTLRAVCQNIPGSICTQNAVVKEEVLKIKEASKRGYQEAAPGDSVCLAFAGSNTRRSRVGKGIVKTIDTGNHHGVVMPQGRIRRLMPRECLRLQGFDEHQIDSILSVSSDTQAYKQAGNAVTVNVVHALGTRLKSAHEASVAATGADMEAA